MWYIVAFIIGGCAGMIVAGLLGAHSTSEAEERAYLQGIEDAKKEILDKATKHFKGE